jgi:hypothetical protein
MICDKHNVSTDTPTCPMCDYEDDHPPVQKLGTTDLSPEQLQALHQQINTVPVAQTISPEPPKGSITFQAFKELQTRLQNPSLGPFTCHDCNKTIYLLDVDHPRPQSQIGVFCPDGRLRCHYHSQNPLLTPNGAYNFQKCPHSVPLDVECQECSKPSTEMVDGLKVSTDTHSYHLIPQIALERLCERIQLGEQTKGKDAWNALSENQHVLDSKKALARRFGHTINHAYRLLGKIQRGEEWTEEDEKEASAVMWGGMFAVCAIHQQRKNK